MLVIVTREIRLEYTSFQTDHITGKFPSSQALEMNFGSSIRHIDSETTHKKCQEVVRASTWTTLNNIVPEL
jgi:hypothetical protein